MSNITRAWKDAAYRQSLSAEEQAMLPENPAGGFELTDADLEAVYGACGCACGCACGADKGNVSSRDFCSNAQICIISATTADSDNSCISIGIGNNCNDNS